MAQGLAYGDGLLAGLGELGPIGRHGCIQVDLAAVHQYVHAQRRHALGHRGHVDDGVFFPGLGAFDVEITAPQIDGFLAVDIDAHGGGEFVARFKILDERIADTGEAVVAMSVDQNFDITHGCLSSPAQPGRWLASPFETALARLLRMRLFVLGILTKILILRSDRRSRLEGWGLVASS